MTDCNNNEWQSTITNPPPLGVEVMTKIDNVYGCRNECTLKREQSSPHCKPLWFVPDGSMYVYYEPTHWRPL